MKTTKASDLREKSVQDLRNRERDLSEQMFKLRFQRTAGTVENPGKIKLVRREIARIKTLLKEKSKA